MDCAWFRYKVTTKDSTEVRDWISYSESYVHTIGKMLAIYHSNNWKQISIKNFQRLRRNSQSYKQLLSSHSLVDLYLQNYCSFEQDACMPSFQSCRLSAHHMITLSWLFGSYKCSHHHRQYGLNLTPWQKRYIKMSWLLQFGLWQFKFHCYYIKTLHKNYTKISNYLLLSNSAKCR